MANWRLIRKVLFCLYIYMQLAYFRQLSWNSNRTIFDLFDYYRLIHNIDLPFHHQSRSAMELGQNETPQFAVNLFIFSFQFEKKKLKVMIKYSKFFTPWTALFFIILKVFVASDVSSTGIKRQDGVKLNNRLLESVHGVGFIMCIRECQTREDCLSVSYSRSHLICDLHRSSVRKENDASLVSEDPLFTYVDMADVASVRF